MKMTVSVLHSDSSARLLQIRRRAPLSFRVSDLGTTEFLREQLVGAWSYRHLSVEGNGAYYLASKEAGDS